MEGTLILLTFAVIMAKTAGKTIHDPQIGEVVFRKSTGRRSIGIRVHPVKGVSVTFPYILPYAAAQAFFQLRRDWVIRTMAHQKARLGNAHVASAEEIEELRRKAKEVLPVRLSELASRYGFVYNRVTIKHNASNWGSCSSKGNINLNLNIVRLPSVLQDYILLHELCHLRHHDHGHAFHLLLEHVLTDNLLKWVDAGDALASDLAGKAAASKAKYPLDYVMTRAIKRYPLV